MSPIRKPIKIEVIDEDEVGPSKPKKKAVAKTKLVKSVVEPVVVAEEKEAVTQVPPVDTSASTEAKKKAVTDAINNEDTDNNSFAEKLKKELESGGSAPIKNRKISVAQEGAAVATATPTPKLQPSVSSVNEDEEIQEIMQAKDRTRRSVGIYKKIAYFFIFLVIILALASAYFLLGKVTIVLIPNQEKMSNNLIFDVADMDSEASVGASTVKGVVKTVEIEQEKRFPATGAEVIGKEAIGKVKIVNSYTKNQMLVATTRLLAASGEMFRVKNTVNVPAGGEIEAEIYADDPSPEMAIGPTKFTIPGLWAGLQDKIYAQSDKAVVYQQKTKKHVTQEDIDNSTKDMRQQLLASAKEEAKKTYSDYDEMIYDIDEDTIKSTVDAEVGDEVDELGVKMTADVIIIAFTSNAAAQLAEQKFSSSLANNKEMISFDKESIIYSLNNYNSTEGKATVNATFEGKVSLKNGESIINKEKIVGLNKQQLESFLKDLPDISGADIKFHPAFLPDFLKKVPRLPERIIVKVKE